jgi:hypothetical protein
MLAQVCALLSTRGRTLASLPLSDGQRRISTYPACHVLFHSHFGRGRPYEARQGVAPRSAVEAFQNPRFPRSHSGANAHYKARRRHECAFVPERRRLPSAARRTRCHSKRTQRPDRATCDEGHGEQNPLCVPRLPGRIRCRWNRAGFRRRGGATCCSSKRCGF